LELFFLGDYKMKIGYVRISTVEQNEARQVDALKRFQVEKMYIDKQSGKDTKSEQLQLMLDFVREGDEIYKHSDWKTHADHDWCNRRV
jgi:DNA invertase Pin-like site-specific DNA recombinase